MIVSSVYNRSSLDEERLGKGCSTLLILDGNHPELLEKNNLPEYITYDRAASIIAARYLFKGKGVSVFDFGTTLTVDFIRPYGSYEGGNISLGCRTRFKALNRYSRALPLIDTPSDPPEIGTSGVSSMEAGVISGIMFEINGYVALKPDNILAFTGGDAIYFAKRMKNSIFVICNLVLMGLALIADEYVNQKV
jgi:type III pantothenate kinase